MCSSFLKPRFRNFLVALARKRPCIEHLTPVDVRHRREDLGLEIFAPFPMKDLVLISGDDPMSLGTQAHEPGVDAELAIGSVSVHSVQEV